MDARVSAAKTTISWITGKPVSQVAINRIRPTNVLSRNVRNLNYAPILVCAVDKFYYTVDGNHRFFRKLVVGDFTDSIPAWVLEEGDQPRLEGNILPHNLRDWKEGRISLTSLREMAVLAYTRMREEVNVTLRYFGVLQPDNQKQRRAPRPYVRAPKSDPSETQSAYTELTTRILPQTLFHELRTLALERQSSVEEVLNVVVACGLRVLKGDDIRT